MSIEAGLSMAIKRNPEQLKRLLLDEYDIVVKFKVIARSEEQAFEIVSDAVGDSPVLSQYWFSGYNPLHSSDETGENNEG